MANDGEYRSKIGLDSLHVAKVTADSASAYTAETPEYLAPAAEASHETSQNVKTQFADDAPYDVMHSEGETKIKLQVTGLPLEMLARITGRQFDAASGRLFDDGNSTPPYMALSFRSLKSNGAYRYYQYLKGRFDVPAEEFVTKGDDPDPKTVELVYTAIPTVYKFTLASGVARVQKKIQGDEDTVNFSAAGWFSQVQTPAAVAPGALALSSSTPADGATGVSVSSNITLTFNNALVDKAIYQVVLAKADGAVAACTNSLDATKKIMTVNPDSNMDPSMVHILAIAVQDVYGQTLRAAINFTTA